MDVADIDIDANRDETWQSRAIWIICLGTPSIGLGTPSNTSSAPEPSGVSSDIGFTRLPLPQLARKDFPEVKHWTAANYHSSRKAGKSGANDDPEIQEEKKGSILSCYMEDENGDQVSEATKKAARETARGYFNLLHDHNQLPSIWGNLSLDLKNHTFK